MQIHRRSFLKTAAAAVPTAALLDLAAHASPSPSTSPLHPVGAGEDVSGHIHSLGFSSLAFKVSTAQSGGNLFVIEHRNLLPATGPALHLHLRQEEWFYVMEGEVIFQVGEQRVTLHVGESILAPRQIPHTFSAVGAPAHMLIAFTPAGKMEQYFTDAVKQPQLAATEAFMDRYEVRWVGPSPFWKA